LDPSQVGITSPALDGAVVFLNRICILGVDGFSDRNNNSLGCRNIDGAVVFPGEGQQTQGSQTYTHSCTTSITFVSVVVLINLHVKNLFSFPQIRITTLWDVKTSPALDGAVVFLNGNEN
jgi:hypothetical protein